MSYKKCWKWSPPTSRQAERRALEDIFGNPTDFISAVSFGETFHTLHQWVYRVRFFLENHDFISVSLIDDMVPICHAFLDDNSHLTSVNEWCSLPQFATKHCLIEAVACCDTLFSVVDVRWHSNPLYKCSSCISQWEVSRLSPVAWNCKFSTNPRFVFAGDVAELPYAAICQMNI